MRIQMCAKGPKRFEVCGPATSQFTDPAWAGDALSLSPVQADALLIYDGNALTTTLSKVNIRVG